MSLLSLINIHKQNYHERFLSELREKCFVIFYILNAVNLFTSEVDRNLFCQISLFCTFPTNDGKKTLHTYVIG